MHAGLAEHTVQQVGRGIGHLALLREVGRALHEHAHAQHLLDRIERAERATQQREAAQRADLGAFARGVERHGIAHAAGDDHRGAHARHLAAEVDGAAIAHQRHVVAAGQDLAVEAMAQLGGDEVGDLVAAVWFCHRMSRKTGRHCRQPVRREPIQITPAAGRTVQPSNARNTRPPSIFTG
ncbi:hypothetical protein D9M68_368390 [compost metagenome]